MIDKRSTAIIIQRLQDSMGILSLTELSPPDHIVASLQRYAEAHVPTGDFVRAVLENNLKEAVGRADAQNQVLLPAIVSWCYNNLPSNVWGSVEKVREHLANKPEPAQDHSMGEATSG